MTRSPESVSIIVPTHNRAHLLQRAVQSVVAQTHTNWELIIVDDASKDGTPAVIDRLKGGRIRALRNETARGPAGARNAGILAAAATDFIAFLDDDDEWMPQKLERQLALFRSSPEPLSAVGCGLMLHDEGKEPVLRLPTFSGMVFEDLLARRARGYAAPLILVRRDPQRPDILFDPDLPCLEDAEFSMRVAQRGPLDFVPEPLVRVYRDDGGPHQWNSEKAIVGYQRMSAKYGRELAARPAVRSYYQVCMAFDLARLGRFAESRQQLRAALAGSAHPMRVRVWMAAVATMGGFGARACARVIPIAPPARAETSATLSARAA
jgi:glycosyltransferase involved in cell wall biosynthesis